MQGCENKTQMNAHSVVAKDHPRIVLRGKLDTLIAQLNLIRLQAPAAYRPKLSELTDFCTALMRAEVTDSPLAPWTLLKLTPDEIRERVYHTREYYGVGFLNVARSDDLLLAQLNLLRAMTRETEIAAVKAAVKEDLLTAYNRLSGALYLLMCERAGETQERAEEE